MLYYYTVNGKRFFNFYLAQYESYQTGASVNLYCNTEQYDKLNWKQEPEESMEVLMDRHAHYLRNKYERLIFYWSGGTDSQTMFNVFNRNRIHLDEIVIIANETLSFFPVYIADWLRENYWDRTTVITMLDKLDMNLRSRFITNENWATENVGDLRMLSIGPPDSSARALAEERHGAYNWTMVTGHEKPYLLYQNGTWWARQEDRPIRQTLGRDRVECFFLDPILNLKQSHLLKNALKKLPIKYTNGTKAELVYPTGKSGYAAFARACGRHDELVYGNSSDQKTHHKETTGVKFGETIEIISSEKILKELSKDQNRVAMDYLRGFRSLQSDRGFIEYLNGFALSQPDFLLQTKPVYSKPYNLGE